MEIILKRVEAGIIIPLRHSVLREGQPLETAHFEGDDKEATRHFAAFRDADRELTSPLACASFMHNIFMDMDSMHLRGMATHEEFRGMGIGSRLLDYSIEYIIKESGIRFFWCYARIKASNFYTKHGWEHTGEFVEFPGVGVHKVMIKNVANHKSP